MTFRRLIILFTIFYKSLYSQVSQLKTIELPKSVIQAVFSPDGSNFAVVHANKQIHIFNTNTFENITVLDDKGEGDVCIAYSPDGKYIAAGSWDKTIKLWDISKNKIIRRYYGHTQASRSVAFNNQGNILASAGWDLDIHFWYVPTGINLKNLSGHTQCVRSIAFSPDGTKIATGGYDQLLKLWDIATSKEIFSVKTSSFPVEMVLFSPDGKYIATAGLENNVKVWNATDGSLYKIFKGHTDAIYALAFSPDGKYLVSGGNDNIIHIWDISKGISIYQLKGHSQGIRTLAFSPDGKILISGGVDRKIIVWNVSALKIFPAISKKQEVTMQSQINISINSPSQNPYISTKRILPVSFEIKNSQYNIVHLFLNKFEYTRMVNGEKEVVKPTSVKVNANKNIEIYYDIYLDYEKSEIQLVAFKANSNDFIISPELTVNYFDVEKFSEETNLNLLIINAQKYTDKKFSIEQTKDSPDKLTSILKMQEQNLFKKVFIKIISNQEITSSKINEQLDSIVQKLSNKDMLIIAINGLIIQDNSSKFYIVLPDANFKDISNSIYPLDNILKALLKTKATAGLFINLSNKTKKLPDNYVSINYEQFDNFMEKELTSRKGIFYLSLTSEQPIPFYDMIANSLHPNNDIDKNGIIDLSEMSTFLNQLTKVHSFFRPNFIPIYKK